MMLFTERYSDKIFGVLHCFDRVIIQGTIPGLCYAGGMTSYFWHPSYSAKSTLHFFKKHVF